jgi:hypothetical protein
MAFDLTENLRNLIGVYCSSNVPYTLIEQARKSDDWLNLQEWIVDHLKPEFNWATGIGVIEGAYTMIREAESNGNIKL